MRRFSNWAGTVTTTPSEWHEPESEDAVASVVRRAAATTRRVRVVGSGHSWSAIAAPHDLAMSLDRLSGVIAVDRGRGIASVRGGTRLFQLNAALREQGLALPILGSIAQQSIAGAIGTGTHGSSLVHGNLSSLVESMRLVTGRGELLDLDAGDPRLEGARVHLGALGIVTRVTLRVQPVFSLAETVERVPLERLDLPAIASSAEYVKIWWLPHTKDAHVYRYARTTDADTRRPSAARLRRFDETIMHARVFPALVALERLRPGWIPAFNRLIAPTFLHGRRVGASTLMLCTPMPFVHRETEAAVPLARAGDAFDRIVRLVDDDALRVNMPVEVRFVRGDDAWMSPAQGIDTCQIGAYAGGVPDIDHFFASFWRAMRAVGARPHWGKEMGHDASEIAARYPLIDRFRALRDALDPDRVFATPFHTRTLGA